MTTLRMVLLIACCATGIMGLNSAPLIAELEMGKCSGNLLLDARAEDNPYLCQSSHRIKDEFFTCQNYVSPIGRYRVYFKGGAYPKAITILNNKRNSDDLIWSQEEDTDRPVCGLSPPAQIPVSTKFMGAGVCKNEAEETIPCAVFRQKSARVDEISDFIVFYDKYGAGPQSTTSIYIDVNRDAAAAELAYQIGLNLLKTRCCQHSGLQYIFYAYQLFPDFYLYRTSYNFYSFALSRKSTYSNLTAGSYDEFDSNIDASSLRQ